VIYGFFGSSVVSDSIDMSSVPG